MGRGISDCKLQIADLQLEMKQIVNCKLQIANLQFVTALPPYRRSGQ